jgi:crossover junction endodeoxyribonuclease RusA
MMQEFELPWPPSVNHYYRHVGPRVLISREGRLYRETVGAILAANGVCTMQGKVALHAQFYPPDNRRRDLDNVGGKVLLDALQAAGAFKDDSQVKRILLEMHEPIENGMCHVRLENFNGKN